MKGEQIETYFASVLSGVSQDLNTVSNISKSAIISLIFPKIMVCSHTVCKQSCHLFLLVFDQSADYVLD